ncbi:MAG: Long-chain-fatty-acid--CoA ligase FadD15 [Bacteroidetes bacterium ADurb.Bin145]|jgi:long-chain acyl-CoA synthetase|nr:MAG: Long-chain-fatty-acid--CoA ligase FadD15 [Bacteroidetes bacterium ADurb.Bin145]
MEENKEKLTFPSLFYSTLNRCGNSPAYAFVGEEPITFRTAAKMINSVTALLEKAGIGPGDKVAILSANMPNWAITYFGITFMGAVVVPILPDFSPTEIANVLEHSESKAIFVSSGLAGKISEFRSSNLRTYIMIEDFSIIESDNPALEYNSELSPESEYNVEEDDLASIIYTSGTTGRSKGVMLTHKNISFNALKGRVIQYLDENDRFLSVLPLSHTYENTLGLILPMLSGACVYYLQKPPTPTVLIPALELIRPTAMLTVPLIIEKIYYNKILPTFNNKKILRLIYKIPLIRKALNKVAGKKLMKTFGGEIKFFGIGGAKLNKTVEKFLREASFPYAIGYGLTETSPLLAGANPKKTVYESTGPAIEDIELKINDPDPRTGEGEIWARGANIMKGYYKEPEMTSAVLTSDGWFKTGDLGVLDKRNNLFIKGRLKNMIVGASGENIYPEEIESVINNFRFVVESLVIQQKGKLVALVHLNMEEIEKRYQVFRQDMSEKLEEKKKELLNELKEYVNSNVNKFSQIYRVELQPVPFQKTATLKIKRFLYT